jgi:hypothetical protein
MTTWKLAVLVPLGVVQLSQLSLPVAAQEPTAQSTALDRLRTGESTGKFKEIEVTGKSRIADPAPVDQAKERPVLKAASLQPTPAPVGVVDRAILEAELNQRVRDLDGCRTTVARSEGVKREESPAGLVTMRWTIQPDGRTKNTLVFQQQATSLDLMKCVRKRMDAWQFTPPSGGPVVVEHTYRLTPPGPAVAEGEQPPRGQPKQDSTPKPVTENK